MSLVVMESRYALAIGVCCCIRTWGGGTRNVEDVVVGAVVIVAASFLSSFSALVSIFRVSLGYGVMAGI